LAALDPRQSRIVRSLRPRGEITVWRRFERPSGGGLDRKVHIGLSDCSIDYDPFPYALERVRGNLIWENGEWRFSELRGQRDSAFIVCRGNWSPDGQGLHLHFEATDVPLDDRLKNALRPSAQKLWANLNPRGTLD